MGATQLLRSEDQGDTASTSPSHTMDVPVCGLRVGSQGRASGRNWYIMTVIWRRNLLTEVASRKKKKRKEQTSQKECFPCVFPRLHITKNLSVPSALLIHKGLRMDPAQNQDLTAAGAHHCFPGLRMTQPQNLPCAASALLPTSPFLQSALCRSHWRIPAPPQPSGKWKGFEVGLTLSTPIRAPHSPHFASQGANMEPMTVYASVMLPIS